ncbi:hypothetical protein [Nocardia sp. NPDC056100]|uniref:hypothetical protein n=1 Tax=Nocardia sp. NPDC056100 TaxID=3345712 RepID=UPI0035D95D9A
MKFTSHGSALTALTAVALGLAAGTATADPGALPTESPRSDSMSITLAPGVQFQDGGAGGTALLTTPIGSVAMRAGQFDLRDVTGQTLAGTSIDTSELGDIAGVPDPLVGDGVNPAAVEPAVASVADDNGTAVDLVVAIKTANAHMASALAVGGVAGSVLGAIVGCPFGVLTGGTLLTAASAGTMILPVMAATCLVGAVAVGGLGATVGGLAVAIPVGLAAGTATFNHMQAERAAGRDPLLTLQK